MMTYKKCPILFIAIILLLLAVNCNAADIKEGQWKITFQISMTGMDMAPVTHSQCLTKNTPIPEQPSQNCQVTDMQIIGNTVTWTVTCDVPGAGTLTGKGKVTYQSDRMDGFMTISSGEWKMKSTFSGEYVGPCN